MFIYIGHFHRWFWGLLPLGLFIIITAYLIYAKILTWDDPIQAMLEGDAKPVDAEEKKEGDAVEA
jgi:hypothetical protein